LILALPAGARPFDQTLQKGIREALVGRSFLLSLSERFMLAQKRTPVEPCALESLPA
jgi:hypothetical protein